MWASLQNKPALPRRKNHRSSQWPTEEHTSPYLRITAFKVMRCGTLAWESDDLGSDPHLPGGVVTMVGSEIR